jgi:hypothetical protein
LPRRRHRRLWWLRRSQVVREAPRGSIRPGWHPCRLLARCRLCVSHRTRLCRSCPAPLTASRETPPCGSSTVRGPELLQLFPPLSHDRLNRIIGCHHGDPRLSIHAARRHQICIPLATASSSRRSHVTQILYRGRSRSPLYLPSIITVHQFLCGGAQQTVRRVNLLDVITRPLKTYYGSGMICGA